jgi:hypothetical protein
MKRVIFIIVLKGGRINIKYFLIINRKFTLLNSILLKYKLRIYILF